MKREIKFRGLRADGEGWVYGYFVKTPLGECRIYLQPFHEATSNTWYKVINDSVGEYTGTWDMTDIDIFEGDIVFNHAQEGRCNSNSIEFEMGRFQILQWDEPEEHVFVDLYSVFEELNVIGNIHEHPELLQGKRCFKQTERAT